MDLQFNSAAPSDAECGAVDALLGARADEQGAEARERRHLWSSRPGTWLLASSAVDLAIVSTLAINGILMAPLPIAILVSLFAAACVLAIVLDWVKVILFARLQIA